MKYPLPQAPGSREPAFGSVAWLFPGCTMLGVRERRTASVGRLPAVPAEGPGLGCVPRSRIPGFCASPQPFLPQQRVGTVARRVLAGACDLLLLVLPSFKL